MPLAPGGMGGRGRQRGTALGCRRRDCQSTESIRQDYYAAMLIKGVGMIIEKDT